MYGYSGGLDHKMRFEDRKPFPGAREARFYGPGLGIWPRGDPETSNLEGPVPKKRETLYVVGRYIYGSLRLNTVLIRF